MAGWPSLTSELVHIILSLLTKLDLHHLSLTNKTFRAAAEPYLYSHLEWTWRGPKRPPIVAFTRTLLRRPGLASYVERFTLLEDDAYTDIIRGNKRGLLSYGVPSRPHRPQADWCNCDWCWHRRSPRTQVAGVQQLPLNGFDPESALLVVRATRVRFWHDWMQALRAGKLDAFLALLLAQTPNLRSFHIDDELNSGRVRILVPQLFRAAILRQHSNSLPTFDKLERTSYSQFSGVHGHRGKRTDHFTQLFRLPAVAFLRISLDNMQHTDLPKRRSLIFQNITHLELSHVRDRLLPDLLSLVPRLRHFRWLYVFTMPYLLNENVIDLDTVSEALAPLRDTLECLTMLAHNDSFDGMRAEPINFRGSLRGLRALTQLRNLTAPFAYLGAGFFPWPHMEAKESIPINVQHVTVTADLFEQEWDNEVRQENDENYPHDEELLAQWLTRWLAGLQESPGSELKRLSILGRTECFSEGMCGQSVDWDPVKALTHELGIRLDFDVLPHGETSVTTLQRLDHFALSN